MPGGALVRSTARGRLNPKRVCVSLSGKMALEGHGKGGRGDPALCVGNPRSSTLEESYLTFVSEGQKQEWGTSRSGGTDVGTHSPRRPA